jgi:tRNA dimethylallyltransferase
LSSDTKKTVVIICGPTAAGKTSVAIHIAKHFQTEIISADSRQCYRELNIGVARPSAQELKEIKHHFIASHSIHEEVNAAVFEKFAVEKTKELFQHHDLIVMVGGDRFVYQGFYGRIRQHPDIDPAIRENIIRNYETKGLEWLQQEVKVKDPLFYEKGEIQNPQRMMRALEVMEATGRSIFSFHNAAKIKEILPLLILDWSCPKKNFTGTSIQERIK